MATVEISNRPLALTLNPQVDPITKKSDPTSVSIRIVFLTSNEFKKKEYKEFLGDGFGVRLFYENPVEELTEEVARRILSQMNPTPHYILREESQLIDARTNKVIAGHEIVKCPKEAPPFLYNKAFVHVWKPIWNKDSFLENIEHSSYEHQIKGYIEPEYEHKKDDTVFGWDHLFVNAETGRTNLENSTSTWGKNSARQLVLGDFVLQHLFYAKPQTLKHHAELNFKQSIEFSEKNSVSEFIKNNPYLSNQHLNKWGLYDLRQRILDEGVFFKAAISRPMKNYFSPPFAGIPLTAKKTKVEETIFFAHDLNHQNIYDPIFDGVDSPEMRNVYMAWRMMSEAMTIVKADMFYADTLVIDNPENEKSVDQRIYPLFKALDLEEVSQENRQQIMTSVLWANVQYAVLGDDSEWKKLLKKEEESKLEAYQNHFAKFFVGDHVWTFANFRNMASLKTTYTDWIGRVGEDLLQRAKLSTLSTIANKVKTRGANLLSLKDTVRYVFDEIIETRIFPKVLSSPGNVTEEERLSRAFLRYMIGQLSFYSRYITLPGMAERADALRQTLNKDFFSHTDREKIRKQYTNDVRYVWGMGCITTSSALNFSEVHPIFPPVYINYSKQECKTVAEVIVKLYGSDSLSS
jgi:hypothetical protein